MREHCPCLCLFVLSCAGQDPRALKYPDQVQSHRAPTERTNVLLMGAKCPWVLTLDEGSAERKIMTRARDTQNSDLHKGLKAWALAKRTVSVADGADEDVKIPDFTSADMSFSLAQAKFVLQMPGAFSIEAFQAGRFRVNSMLSASGQDKLTQLPPSTK